MYGIYLNTNGIKSLNISGRYYRFRSLYYIVGKKFGTEKKAYKSIGVAIFLIIKLTLLGNNELIPSAIPPKSITTTILSFVIMLENNMLINTNNIAVNKDNPNVSHILKNFSSAISLILSSTSAAIRRQRNSLNIKSTIFMIKVARTANNPQ